MESKVKYLALVTAMILLFTLIPVEATYHSEEMKEKELKEADQREIDDRYTIESLFNRDELDDNYPHDMDTIKSMSLEDLNWTNQDIDGSGEADWELNYTDSETGENRSLRVIEGTFGGEDMRGGNDYTMYTEEQIREGNLTDPKTVHLKHGGILVLPHDYSTAEGDGKGIFLNTHGLPTLSEDDPLIRAIVVSVSEEFGLPIFVMGEFSHNWESFGYSSQDMITFPSLLPSLMKENASAENLKMFYPYALLRSNLLGHTVFQQLTKEYGMNIDEGIFSEGASKQGFVRWHAAMLDERIKVAQCDMLQIQDLLNSTRRYYLDWGRPPIENHTCWANYSSQISSLMTAMGDTFITGLTNTSGPVQTVYDVWDIHNQAHLLEGTEFISITGSVGTGGYDGDEWETDHDGTYFPVGAESNFLDKLDEYDVDWRYGRDRGTLESKGAYVLAENRMINNWLNGMNYMIEKDLSDWVKVDEVYTQTESYNETHNWFNVTAEIKNQQENTTVELRYAGNSDRRWNDPEHCVDTGEHPWTYKVMDETDTNVYETSIKVEKELMYGYYVEAYSPGIETHLAGNPLNTNRYDASPMRLLNEYPPEIEGITDLFIDNHEAEPALPEKGETVELTVEVVADRPDIYWGGSFKSLPPLKNIDVELSIDGSVEDVKTINFERRKQVTFDWTIYTSEDQEVKVTVDPSNILPEYDEENNVYEFELQVYKDIVLDSPYEKRYDHQHKAQLHTHTTNSDGALEPTELMNMYEDLGYAVVAITDHDTFIWDPCLEDPGGHDIIHIPGIEYSTGHHMATIGIESIQYPSLDQRQAQIDQANEEGGLSHYAHPDRYDKEYSRKYYEETKGYAGIEIMNRGTIERESDVDFILSELGREITLTSVDDYHDGTPNRGFVSILSDKPEEDLTYDDVMDYLRDGQFYARGHRGAEDHPRLDIWTEGDTIYVESDKVVDIEFTTANYNYYKEGEDYAKIVTNTTEANYTAQVDDGYVRIKATHEGDRDAYAFSNPIYVRVPGEPDHLDIGPKEETIDAGDSVEYTAILRDEDGVRIKDVTSETDWSIEKEAGGNWVNNMYTSEISGAWTITGEYTEEDVSYTATSGLIVEPGHLDHIGIEPKEDAVISGDSLSYSATAYDEFKNKIEDVTKETDWSIEQEAGGTWDENVYTSENTGEWEVTGDYTYEGTTFTDQTSLIVEDDVVIQHIEIHPQEITVSAGDTLEYYARAHDGDDDYNITTETTWSIEQEAGGHWYENVYTSENAGEWTVTGNYTFEGEDLVVTANLTVEPAGLNEVTIEPSDDQTITAGQNIEFSATAYDGHENLITEDDSEFTWENATHGLFDETKTGGYRVTASYAGLISSTVNVTVETASPDHITIGPKEDSVISGDSIRYNALLRDEYVNVIEDITTETDFSIEDGAGGSWDDDTGVYTSENLGTWNVTGNYSYEGNEMSDNATLHVEEAELDYIEIYPQNLTVTADDSIEFVAFAYDDEDTYNVTTEVNWWIEDEAGGSWSDDVYTSEYSGAWTVTGNYSYHGGDLIGETTLFVEPDEVDSVTIEPLGNYTIPAGMFALFEAEAYDHNENLITECPTEFAWENSSAGIFTKREVGLYRITAAYDGVTSDASYVTVEPGDPDHLEIEPEDETIIAGDAVDYSARVFDEYENEILVSKDNITWSIEDEAGGTWDENTYTSEKSGTWTVVATYTYDEEEVSREATLEVEPAGLDNISIEPEEKIVITGDEVVYTGFTIDRYGNEIEEVTLDTDFKIEEEAGGTWASGHIYVAENIGTWIVTGIYSHNREEFTAQAVLTVEPAEYELSISVQGEGTTDPPQGTNTFGNGEVVTVEAIPDEGWYFVEWTGDIEQIEDPEENKTTIEMLDDYDITADFQVYEYNLEINIEGDGFVELDPEEERYEHGTEVELSAVPDEGWTFVEWTGDFEGTDENMTIVMDEDKEITAHFEELETYELTVNIEGEGEVVMEPDQEEYEEGTEVDLTALPDEGWYFYDWAGDVLEGEEGEQITIIMDQNKEVTAVFEEEVEYYELTINIQGEGEVDIDPHEEEYEEGTEVNLTALPNEGWLFTEWRGDFEGTDEQINITMDENKEVTAVFEEEVEYYEVIVNIEGKGEVDIDPHEEEYEEGTEVSLTAVPAEGWLFTEWRGDFEGTDEQIDITVDENKEVTAVFEEEPIEKYDLTVSIEGEGITEPEEGTHTYREGEVVTVEAMPEEGWYFVEWTGDHESTDEQITMVMDSDKELTAWFEEDVEYHELEVNIDGEGTVEVEPEQEEYEAGTEVTLTAVPAEGWKFVEWRGDETSTETEITVTMDEDKTITAYFEELGPAEFEFSALTVEPEEPEVGEEIKISVDVTNVGELVGEYTVEFYVNHSLIDEVDVELEAGETKTVSTTYEIQEAGEYHIGAEEESTTFTVEEDEEKTSNWLLVVLILLIMAIIVFVWKRSGGDGIPDESDGQEEEKDEEESSSKETEEE